MSAKIEGPGSLEQYRSVRNTREKGVGRKEENYERPELGVRGDDYSVIASCPDGLIHPKRCSKYSMGM